MWDGTIEYRKRYHPIKRWIANNIDKIWEDDLHDPDFPKWFIKIYRWCGGIIFNKICFPMVGKTEKRIFYDSGEWYCETTFIPIKWPELTMQDIVGVQPMRDSSEIEFKMNFI